MFGRGASGFAGQVFAAFSGEEDGDGYDEPVLVTAMAHPATT